MHTENLINLFGGTGDKEKSNNTPIIIGIIVLVCLCIVVLGGGYYMMNKKKKNDKHKEEKKEDKKEEKKEDEKEEEKEDNCAGYDDSSEDYSLECIEQLWKDTGCTTDFKDTMKSKMDESVSKGQKMPPFGVFKNGLNMMINMADEGKEMCYGPDKSKWPASKCDEYTNESTNISDDCITEIYSKACPAFNINNLSSKEQTEIKKSPLGFVKLGGYIISTQGDDRTRTSCYGEDKSKWPPVCSHFQDESNFVSKECVQEMWTTAGCTKEISEDVGFEGNLLKMKEIKDNINNIATSTDPEIKSKCN